MVTAFAILAMFLLHLSYFPLENQEIVITEISELGMTDFLPSPFSRPSSNFSFFLKEITFLCWRLCDLLVRVAEKQSRHASFPAEGSPPTEAKNGDGGGVKGLN